MKTIREPQGPPPPKVFHLECSNKNCRAIMEVLDNELKSHAVSYKQEVYLVMRCPHCHDDSYFEIQNMTQYLVRED